MTELEKYFKKFRKNIVGINASFESAFGKQKIIYADWIASGRLYGPIEDKIKNDFGPYVANTHTETTETGLKMTKAYHYAHQLIKKHVNAGEKDVIITAGFGMTGAISKLIRILGLNIPEQLQKHCNIPEDEKPVVFITHMEHHSNQLPWLESIADMYILPYGEDLLTSLEAAREFIQKYSHKKHIIGAFSACSNVTGIETPYYKLAEMIHDVGGQCFVDFAASAPYVDINMHPENQSSNLMLFFSPHINF